jgi:hypothetical protein
MKIFRFALNIWITLVSILSFLIGWVALAHSPKPVQPSSRQFSGDNGFQQNFQVQNGFSSAPQPIFRTGGS